MSQLNRLNAALSSRPNDPFVLYAIAMEHLKLEQSELALEKFSALTKSHPDYVPTYLQFGMALADSGQAETAQQVLRTGHEIAVKAGDLHTASEIAQALEGISYQP